MKKRRWKQGLAVFLGLTLGIYAPVTALQGRYPVYAYTERSASVNATSLNVRSDAGTSYSAVGKLSRGASVTVVGEKTGTDGKLWYQVRFTGTGGSTVTGYVLGSYLKVSTTTSSSSTSSSTSTSYKTDRSFESQLSDFPESYKSALRQLHAQYPNWRFEAHNTGLDWNTVIENESLLGRNLVHTNSISSFKSTADGAYNWDSSTWNGFDGSSWVAASEDVIRYYMDPRNFLDGTYIFQFLSQEYDASLQTKEGLQSMLNGTFMQGGIVSSGSASGATGVDTSSGNASDGSSNSGSSGGTSYGPGGSGSSSSAPGGQSAVITAPDKRRQNSSSSSGNSSSSSPSTSGTTSGTISSTPGTSTTTSGSAGTSSSPSAGTSSGPGGSSTSGTPGTSSSGNSNSQAPTRGSDGNVRFQGPSASISRHQTSLVTAPDALTAGPGTSAGAATFTAPGSAGPGGSTISGTNTGTTGNTTTSGTTYADLIMSVAGSTGLNPYIIASTILQEQGSDGRGKSISGTYSGYAGYYNYFNIGAYASGGMDAVGRGLWYASQSGTYGRPWNTPEKSITGGAQYYATNYVKAGQDTLYLKKFNVQGSNIYKHQYMTNVEAAASEGALFAQGYGNVLKNSALTFKIPVYNNMPSSPCAKPTGTGSPNNKLRSLGVDGFSLTPTFNRDTMSYDLIVDQSVTSVNVSATAIDSSATTSGNGNVSLSGTSTDIKVIVTAQNGTQRTYTIHVVRKANGPTYGGSTNGGQNSTNQTPGQTPGGSSTGNGTINSPVVSITPGGSSSSSTSGSSGNSTQVVPVIGVAPGQ